MAAIEVALMVVNLPHVPELVGNGDIPLDPTFGFMARWYRFIPIRRGYVDRRALQEAREVLNRGQVLGLFPEGGIWEHNAKSARPGVAWLSQQTGVPILPVGFSGVWGAMGRMFRLKRPHMMVNIGPLMPPVPNPSSHRERKIAIQEASVEMMQRINSLVRDDPVVRQEIGEETYDFRLEVMRNNGQNVTLPSDLVIPYGEDLSYYFHRYVLLEVVYRNYKLDGAKPLSRYPQLTDPTQLGPALDVALDFYRENPVFLGYRLGYSRAERVMDSLVSLRDALAWAEREGYQVRILPERTIINDGGETRTFIEPSVKREY
jgi:hypothetical protein